MGKTKFTKKALYEKKNSFLTWLNLPKFRVTSLHSHAKKTARFSYDFLKEMLAPIAAVLGLFVVYLLSKFSLGDNLQGNITAIIQTGGSSVVSGNGLTTPEKPAGTADSESLLELIIGFTNWALPYIVVIAVVMIIYAGVLMLIAAGDEGKISTGKTIILWTVIALFIVLSAFAIVNTVVNFA